MTLEKLRHCEDWADSHLFSATTGDGGAPVDTERLDAEFLRALAQLVVARNNVGVGNQPGRPAVADFGRRQRQLARVDHRQQRRRLRCWRNPHTGEYTAPGETCIRKLLYRIDAEQVENVVAIWMEGLDPNELRCIAVDGKTLKGTAKRDENGEKKGALHLVSAVAHGNARMLAQEALESKSNEIPAVQRLINRFPHLDGIVVTGDALNAQQETARLIVQEKGGLQPAAEGQSAHLFSEGDRSAGTRVGLSAAAGTDNPQWRSHRHSPHLGLPDQC